MDRRFYVAKTRLKIAREDRSKVWCRNLFL